MSLREKDYDVTYKILIIGESAVGKTSLIKCYSKPNESFRAALLPTIGIDFVTVVTNVDGVHVRLQIWDTAGQERFRTLTSMHFRGTKGILLVYDITNAHSFDQLQYWIKTMNKHNLMYEEVILVGNKCDYDRKSWEVDTQTGKELARQFGLKFFETSAKTQKNVQEVFQELAKNVKYANDSDMVINSDEDGWDKIDAGIRLQSCDYPQHKKTMANCGCTK